MEEKTSQRGLIERRAIEYVPLEERHGRPVTLLTIWFASNAQITSVATGALATVVFGLSVPWAIFSIIVGNLVGGLFMAYHSVQGPRLGMPQMIQSRAQFGMFGAILPIFFVVIMYIGFFVSSAILGGEAMGRLFHVSTNWGIVIVNLITLAMAWIGYDLIHRYDRWASVLFALVFIAITIKLATVHHAAYHATGDTFANVLLVISIFVSWQITWAPYVSDYSRYLPADTPAGQTFWYTYLGSAVGAIWMMIIGAVAGTFAASAISGDTAGYFAGLFPAVQWLILITAILGILAAHVENLYGPVLAGGGGGAARGEGGGAAGPGHGGRGAGRPAGRGGRGRGDWHAAGHPRQRAPADGSVELRAVPAVLHDPVDGDQPHRLLPGAPGAVSDRGDVPARWRLRQGQLVGGRNLRADHIGRGPVREFEPLRRPDREPSRRRGHLVDHRADPLRWPVLPGGSPRRQRRGGRQRGGDQRGAASQIMTS